MNILLLVGAICLHGFITSGCGRRGNKIPKATRPSPTIASEEASFILDTLHTGLEHPWGIAWISPGRMLVTERKGEILIFDENGFTGETVKGFPDVYVQGQGGLMDIQVHPNHTENGWIYVTYAKPGKGGGSTALARFKLMDDEISEWEDLYVTAPLSETGVHFGSRIVFDSQAHVFFSTGDRGVNENAQRLSNDMGKIIRLLDDGEIPADNPFTSTPGAKTGIWSYGHRNIQGMAFDTSSHILYATEHGPRGGDELNIIEKGKNYGWPAITYGIDYNGATISEYVEKEGMEQPIHYWTPSIASSGLLFYQGNHFPAWNGNLFTGALAGMHMRRVVVQNERYQHEEKLLDKIGRVRHIAQGPDGMIYILTEGPGMLVRVLPSK